jgi:hypothetical protein
MTYRIESASTRAVRRRSGKRRRLIRIKRTRGAAPIVAAGGDYLMYIVVRLRSTAEAARRGRRNDLGRRIIEESLHASYRNSDV